MWLDPVAARLPIWNLGAPAECLLDLLLKYRSDLEASLARTRSDREAFARALEALPLVECVVSGGGNFLLVHLVSGDPRLAGAVRRELLASWRIEVKDVSARLGGPYLRVAVRKPEENEYFTTALAAVGAGIAQA
jgi:histidinol-phosphate/aromatic aminotransferase/cobyric acid decarboxylase-like protein